MENNNENTNIIESYIFRAKNDRNFTNEDLVGIFAPMLMQLENYHSNDFVLLHKGIDSFTANESGRIRLNEGLAIQSKVNLDKIENILPEHNESFDIIAEQDFIADLSEQEIVVIDKEVVDDMADNIVTPVYLTDYKSYEDLFEHHDPLTDIQILGLFMASLAFSLDFRIKEDVEILNKVIKNPVYANNVVHPNLLKLIIDMVQLDRRKRVRDAYSARIRLENYLDYNYNTQEDFDDVLEQYKTEEGDRNKWILSKLRNRLFDLSRRNRLIYFKKSSRYVNLTLGSVPYVLDYKNIRPEKLVIWNEEIENVLKNAGTIKLNNYLKIKENPQIAISLKKVFYEGNRDIAEFGFNQLKLAFCYLNWYNYKENRNEKIQSPLLLIPARLKKRKGINDIFSLELLQTEAQVNPVLSYYLKELFDIRLPQYYDLQTNSIEDIFDDISKRISSKSNEVTLEFVKKPKLRLIHSQAKRSFEQYQKKLRKSIARSIWGGDGNYSYSSGDYRPLGIKLFKERVKKETSLVELLINPDVQLSQSVVSSEVNREFYHLESDGSVNPYLWEFDLCNFTLGNFNYQKMTLVNDYDYLMDNTVSNEIFNKLFSKDPKTDFQKYEDYFKLKDNYSVIPADMTQLNSIRVSGQGQSYIIQGPPGTGKSQTIVNLLANKVAEGKSILFISEKRAALDVVFARMSQVGLKDICILIHDSQTDKKSFIYDIKDTYEMYKSENNNLDEIITKRNKIISDLENLLSVLESFHDYQGKSIDDLSIRGIVEILIQKNFKREMFDPKLFETVMKYGDWIKTKGILEQLEKSILRNTKYESLAQCPFLHMSEKVSSSESTQFVSSNCDILENELLFLQSQLNPVFPNGINEISEMESIVDALKPIVEIHKSIGIDILNDSSDKAKRYQNNKDEIDIIKEKLSEIAEKTKYWKRKPSKDDLVRLNKKYLEAKSGIFNKILGKKNQFIDKLSEYYDFEAHIIAPEPEDIFREIEQELQLKAELEKKYHKYPELAIIEELDMNDVKEKYKYLATKRGDSGLQNDDVFIKLLDNSDKLFTSFDKMIKVKSEILNKTNEIDDIFDELDNLRINAPALFALAPRLKEWFGLDSKIRDFVKNSNLSLDQIEYLSAYKQLLSSLNEPGSSITGAELDRVVKEIKGLYSKFLLINSKYVSEKVKKKFQDALDLSYVPAYELTKEQKKYKASYSEGRAILENEFNKKIRFKSIRELSEKDSGTVINDLKPVWMMSPLSVSDTLPVEQKFDIVIFDEASQITVEEGIPPLFRAAQAIIVGDEMQMPPSNFFSTKIDESDEEAEFLSMDAESLLNQGARKLAQVTLGWHYRSKQEALINFSNFAFYNAQLYTIPDVASSKSENVPIEVFNNEDAVENTNKILQNSISYHYLPNGVYMNRMNDAEADYIAHLVRTFLMKGIDKSIGIVAFSLQQQGNIENSLNNLADKDHHFAVKLEEAFAGKEGEEFTGLFIKNLENVQGDERDIMILSICYGYNPSGKMLMNFGPINRRGGEKRLNVIFSRAKHHMVVVSSIKHSDIKNEYNEGANYFKRYLQYSELISIGENKAAQAILNSLGRKSRKIIDSDQSTDFVNQIKNSLEKEGYFVETNLGQSRLKIALGIKKEKDQDYYDLGILVDKISTYKDKKLLDEYYFTPNILQIFGWKVYKVFAVDWLKNKNLVLKDIIAYLEQKEVVVEIEPPTEEFVEEPVEEETKIELEEELTEEVELVNESKNKYWKIGISKNKVVIEMGEIDKEGVSNTQFFNTETDARAYFDNQIENRKRRGFV